MVLKDFFSNTVEKLRNNSDNNRAVYYLKRFGTRLITRKTITQLQSEADNKNELKRTLGSFQLLALGIGSIIGTLSGFRNTFNRIGFIGTGIFVLSGEAAAKYAGPAVILSFIIAAIVAGLAAFSYAEMSSMVPISGSAYSYTYASML